MLRTFLFRFWQRNCSTKGISRAIDISPEVRSAFDSNKPVVALESTIITHGMPYPHNFETALSVESIVRDQGAVPATIAILNGRIKIGLERQELEYLSKPISSAVKTSRRDFPYVLSHNLNGGTTVSGTLMIASHVGIKVFVTGGVGGVHRYGESTLDISADLVEMGRQPIMVVSSGIKSILDIERTLEYLETQGVCVISYGPSKHFPAFYCEKSGFMAPYHVTQPDEAANVLFQSKLLGMGSGILLAVPVPKPFSIETLTVLLDTRIFSPDEGGIFLESLVKEPLGRFLMNLYHLLLVGRSVPHGVCAGEIMDTSINLALEEAENAGVNGKDITPFVLERVGQLTTGKSLKTNIALIKNNALIGSQVAVAYQKLSNAHKRQIFKLRSVGRGNFNDKVVVVGGSVLDCVMTLQAELKADGRTLPGTISQTPGGVGRNIADCLGKLRGAVDPKVVFISAVGNDQFGEFLLSSIQHLDTSGTCVVGKGRTASYCALIDSNGDAKIGVGDMEIHSTITPSRIVDHEKTLNSCGFVVMDGNIPCETIDCILNTSFDQHIPVWFEPTDVLKAPKPFKSELWKTISCSSPNMYELREMASAAGVKFDGNLEIGNTDELLKQLIYLARPLAEHIPVIMVTMGKLGILMVSRCKPDEPPRDVLIARGKSTIFVRYYPSVPLTDVTNSLGAGDSTAAGFIDGLLRGLGEAECVTLGHLASREALQSPMAVPREFKSYDPVRATKAAFHEIPLS